MTADIVNLREARKAKAKREALDRAAQNRVKFGRGRQEREGADAQAKRAKLILDGHRREDVASPARDPAILQPPDKP
jgi:hypothetical protein